VIPLIPSQARQTMIAILTSLWKLPINDFKETYWRCFLDAIPTAARRHQRDPCGCGNGEVRPDRNHHFNLCALASGLYAEVATQIPVVTTEEIARHLRTASPPANIRIHTGIWQLTSLAAYEAMDEGRRWLWKAIHIERELAGETLVPRALEYTRNRFWTCLANMGQEPLPHSWRKAAAAPHPFLGWDVLNGEWIISKHAAPGVV